MVNAVQLNNVDHATLRVRTERGKLFGDAVMACPVFPHEFRQVQAHYPIVLSKDNHTGVFRPLALFSLEPHRNEFLTDSEWSADYIPLAMRMPPFLIGRTIRDGEEALEVHVDLDHPRVTKEGGTPVFLEHGGHSEFLIGVSDLLGEIHEAEQNLGTFSKMLDDLTLIEPFTLDVTLKDNSTGRLSGYYTIAEERLSSLSAEELQRLQKSGYLQAVFMMVASLSQFTEIIRRRNENLEAQID